MTHLASLRLLELEVAAVRLGGQDLAVLAALVGLEELILHLANEGSGPSYP